MTTSVPSPAVPDPAATTPPGVTPPVTPVPESRSVGDLARIARERLARGEPLLPGVLPTGEAAAAPAAGKPAADKKEAADNTAAADGAGDNASAAADTAAEGGDGDAPTGGDDADALVVELPVRGGGDENQPPIKLELPDAESAEAVRALVRGNLRREDAERAYAAAERLRAEAEEFELAVEMDPIGVVTETVVSPEDQSLLARWLLTRPGVLQQVRGFIEQVLDDPTALATKANEVEAMRITRRDAVTHAVQLKREQRANARAIIRAVDREVQRIAVPTEEARDLLASDILSDISAYQRAKQLRTVPVELVPQFAARRTAALGLHRAAPARGAAPRPGGESPPAPGRQPTGTDFRIAAERRRAAAAPLPGVGSPVAAIPAPPKGSNVKQAVQHIRKLMTGGGPT